MGILDGSKIEKPVSRLIGYGGAAFGGKTDAAIGLAMVAAFAFPGVRIGLFRRNFTELEGPDGPIERSRELLAGITEYNAGQHRHTFPTGSRLYFHHCATEDDRYNYQSQAWDILLIDEATHFTWPIVDYLITRNRPTIDHPDLTPFVGMMTNPGNVGHEWYSQLFDVLKTSGGHRQVKRVLTPNGKYEQSYFIPALLEDNPIGLERDPEYADRLEARDPDVARALRYGDWSVFAGQAFPTWQHNRIACPPREIPLWWPKWRAIDYGYEHPWACGWFAKDPDKDRLYVYRAISLSGLTDERQIAMVKDSTAPEENILFTFASPDMWERKNKDDIVFTTADVYEKGGVVLTRANNDRLGGKRRLHGLMLDKPDGKPGIQVFEPYYSVFGCMVTLIKDPKNPEDVKKVDGDDPYDMLRYGLTNLNLNAGQQAEKQRQVSPLVMAGGML